jgi:hypothetical protein
MFVSAGDRAATSCGEGAFPATRAQWCALLLQRRHRKGRGDQRAHRRLASLPSSRRSPPCSRARVQPTVVRTGWRAIVLSAHEATFGELTRGRRSRHLGGVGAVESLHREAARFRTVVSYGYGAMPTGQFAHALTSKIELTKISLTTENVYVVCVSCGSQ